MQYLNLFFCLHMFTLINLFSDVYILNTDGFRTQFGISLACYYILLHVMIQTFLLSLFTTQPTQLINSCAIRSNYLSALAMAV